MIRIIVQPKIEIDKTVDFRVYFAVHPDESSLQIEAVEGLEITEVTSIEKEGEIFLLRAYIKPTKLGEINIPVISIKADGIEYESNPFSINVVEILDVDFNSVKTVLASDKNTYRLKDTIKLSLSQYSKFSNTSRYTPEDDTISPLDGLSMEGKEGEISVQIEKTLYDISGIKNLDDYLAENFEIIDFEWNPFGEDLRMEKMENEYYIRTNIFTLYLLANKQGEYAFQPGTFEYLVYKNDQDYFEKFTPNDDGSYTITKRGSTELIVQSNSLTITVK